MRDAGIEFIYLEDVRAKISRWQQLGALLRMSLNPQSAIPMEKATAKDAMDQWTAKIARR
jgi:hypothetical protein